MFSIEGKRCSICKKHKSFNDYYSQEKTNAKGEKYIYYRPDCKQCTSEKAWEWSVDNREIKRKHFIKYNNKPDVKPIKKKASQKQRETGVYRQWQKDNPDKIRNYQLKRANKNHDISNDEWEECKKFFHYSCAYCGMSEEDHIKKFNQQLHKDHFNHKGSNRIDNCVPSCKGCNSSKGARDVNVWYDNSNHEFDKSRLDRVYEWLSRFS